MSQQVMRATCGAFLTATLLGTGTLARGKEPWATVAGPAHAKGVVVLKVSFPNQGDLRGVSLAISQDGERFERLDASSLLTSIVHDSETSQVVVSLVGYSSGMGYERFLFGESGRYYVRWGVGFASKDATGFKIHQTLDIEATTRADENTLERLSDSAFLRRLYGKDLFSELPGEEFRHWVESPAGADFRALTVIEQLLQVTRSTEPLEGKHKSADDLIRWADTMFQLAEEFPESSYAPYAAFYAGGGYVGYLCEVLYKDEVPSDAIRKDELFEKAEKALKLGVEHGDSYLRPRAILQQARLHALIGAWHKAERLVDEVENGRGQRGTVSTLSDQLRRDIRKLKRDQQRREMEQGRE